MSGQRYRAFISYSHRDREWGEWLHRALETYVVPRRLVGRDTPMGWVPPRLTPVFRDQEELPSASDLGGKVGEVLAHSDNLIVICSPEAAKSQWVNREIQTFKQLGRADRIFCLIVDGEPNASERPGCESDECFPMALRFALDADGNPDPARRAEPIASDARPNRDGRNIAMHKLIAGLLGVGVDDLRQREQVRRHRRATLIAGLSLLLAIVMVALGVQAILARQAAERRQKQAEALVGFMLGDLDRKLKEVGRLDILGDVADQAMRYFEELPANDISATGLAQRVVALQKIGSVRMEQGKTDPAMKSFEAALRLSKRLATEHPDDLDRQMAYADSLNWIGNLRWQQGDANGAAGFFEQARKVLIASSVVAQDSPELLERISQVATNSGRTLEVAGKLDAAESNYLEVLDAVRKLRQLHPSDDKWLVELGYAYNNLGVLAGKRGKLQQAAAYYQKDLEIKQTISAADPKNKDGQSDVALALMFMADLHGNLGDTEQALAEETQSIDILQNIIAVDPTGVTSQYYLGLAQKGMSRILLDAGRAQQAGVYIQQAQVNLQKAAVDDPDNPRKALRVWGARLMAARQMLQQGDRSGAGVLAADVERGLAVMQPGDANLKEQALLRVTADMLRAEAVEPKDPQLARRFRLGAHDLLSPYVTRSSLDPDLLDPWLRMAASLDVEPFPTQQLRGLADRGYANPAFVSAMKNAGIDYSPVTENIASTDP